MQSARSLTATEGRDILGRRNARVAVAPQRSRVPAPTHEPQEFAQSASQRSLRRRPSKEDLTQSASSFVKRTGSEALKRGQQVGSIIEQLAPLPWSGDLENMRRQVDRASKQLRNQVYSLSKALGEVTQDVNKARAQDQLRLWKQATDRESKAAIERKLAFNGSLLVTDMSGFTRITREEGILHFLSARRTRKLSTCYTPQHSTLPILRLLKPPCISASARASPYPNTVLIKQMQSICLPILSRYGGTLLKVEADDLFVLFPTPGFAVQAAAACIAATKAFSVTKNRKNDKIILSCGIIDGPMWHIPHLDAFGETVEVRANMPFH